jgi:hypothetical protein
MALLFRKDDLARDSGGPDMFASAARVPDASWLLLGLLIALLIAGTLQVGLLTNSYATVDLPMLRTDGLAETLNRLAPFDASRGEEGVTVQGLILIALLATVGVAAWRGLGHVDEGWSKATTVTLALVAFTLLAAALRVKPENGGVTIGFTGKFFAVAALMGAIWLAARRGLEAEAVQEWLWETWRFVRQIFPLLIVGVFAVGVVRPLIRPEWIESLAGSNSLAANAVGVLFGIFMYFPTLVEVPIARLFLDLGMHRGPLLAYLMADPELSLQSILIIASVIGRRKAWAYVGWVAIFSMAAGMIYGAWVDGGSLLTIGAGTAGATIVVFLAVRLATRRAAITTA